MDDISYVKHTIVLLLIENKEFHNMSILLEICCMFSAIVKFLRQKYIFRRFTVQPLKATLIYLYVFIKFQGKYLKVILQRAIDVCQFIFFLLSTFQELNGFLNC